MSETIKETSDFLRDIADINPQIAIILGTGLGGLVNDIEIKHKISYHKIPNFPVSTVEGHKGELIFGTLGRKPVLALQGRFHYYEGYSMKEVTFPVRVFHEMGVKILFVSNAAGGLNPEFGVGDIMMITDHINMFGTSPLIGPNPDQLGPRFPDMSMAYDLFLRTKAEEIASKHHIDLKQGVYVGVPGPTFETPAEYKMYRLLGGDSIGMSTIPEVIAARHMGMRVFGVSVITDSGVPGRIVEVTHERVQNAAKKAESKLSVIIKELIASI